MTTNSSTNTRGAAGGAAATTGDQFQQHVAAWAAVKLLVGSAAILPWGLPERTFIRRMACQANAEVDDLVLSLSNGGSAYLQVKHGLQRGTEWIKAMVQMVRQFHAPGFSAQHDRLVIFTDTSASGTLRETLRDMLDGIRKLPHDGTLGDVASNAVQKEALNNLRTDVAAAWEASGSALPDERTLRIFLSCLHISAINLFAPEAQAASKELLGRVTENGRVLAVWDHLLAHVHTLARTRSVVDRPTLWKELDGLGVSMRAAQRGGELEFATMWLKGMVEELQVEYQNLDMYSARHYVPRLALNDEFNTFVLCDARLMVVTGQSGHGKSNWCLATASSPLARPVLMIQGERLAAGDKGIVGTACRLVAEYCTRQGMEPPQPHELLEWFKAAKLLLVLDGLDRAGASFQAVSSVWMRDTLAYLAGASAKLLVTSRPEAWQAAAATLSFVPWLLYRTQQQEAPQRLEQFSPEEAGQAAAKRGAAGLERYRHPGMMALAASLRASDQAAWVGHCDVIAHYLEWQLHAVASRANCMAETTDDFIRTLAAKFLEAESGTIAYADIRELVTRDSAVYRELRTASLIAVAGDSVRLNPDEVSEYLQAQQLDIAAALRGLPERQHDNAMLDGVLRSAVVQSERRNVSDGTAHLAQLVTLLEAEGQELVFEFCVRIVLEFRDLQACQPLLERMVGCWTRTNLLLDSAPLAELLGSARLPPAVRMRLLWRIVFQEDGYDWRSKHWLTPDYAPIFHVTAWTVLMRRAVREAGRDGLAFLIEHFDDKDDLDCEESCLGDVARGVFFHAAREQPDDAMELLQQDSRESATNMQNLLMHYRPAAVLPWLAARVADARIDDARAVDLLSWIARDDVPPGYRQLVEALLERTEAGSDRRRCLHLLAPLGHEQAGLELLASPKFDGADLQVILATRQPHFEPLVRTLLQRLADGTVDADIMRSALGAGATDVESQVLVNLLNDYMKCDEACVSELAGLVEHLLHWGQRQPVVPPELSRMAMRILRDGTSSARKYVIYFATSYTPESELSSAGRELRREVLSNILECETEEENLVTLVSNLMTRPAHAAYAMMYAQAVMDKHADIDLLETLRGHHFRPDAAALLRQLKPFPRE